MRLLNVGYTAGGRIASPAGPRPFRARGPHGPAHTAAGFKELKMEQKLKIAVFIDFDNIEIGVKSSAAPRIRRGSRAGRAKRAREIVNQASATPTGRPGSATRRFPSTPVQMVPSRPSPRGDKNGGRRHQPGLDALEMAFTHDHQSPSPSSGGDAISIAW